VDEAGVFQRMSLICPKCGGTMKVVAFITDYAAVDRIIDHLKLTFVAEKPPPSRVIEQVALTRPPREGLRNAALMAAEERVEYFWGEAISRGTGSLSFFGVFRGRSERKSARTV